MQHIEQPLHFPYTVRACLQCCPSFPPLSLRFYGRFLFKSALLIRSAALNDPAAIALLPSQRCHKAHDDTQWVSCASWTEACVIPPPLHPVRWLPEGIRFAPGSRGEWGWWQGGSILRWGEGKMWDGLGPGGGGIGGAGLLLYSTRSIYWTFNAADFHLPRQLYNSLF